MRTPYEEQETVINSYRGDKFVRVYTSDYTMMHKLDKLCGDDDNGWRETKKTYYDGDIVSKEYIAPLGLISFRKRKKVISDERKKQMSENMKRIVSGGDTND
jgi:hypothetical protein